MIPFARTIDSAKKYVVSGTLDRVDWNAELVQGDLGKAVQQLKREPGRGLYVGGVTLQMALADLGLIDEYEFVVHPILAGHFWDTRGSRVRVRPCRDPACWALPGDIVERRPGRSVPQNVEECHS